MSAANEARASKYLVPYFSMLEAARSVIPGAPEINRANHIEHLSALLDAVQREEAEWWYEYMPTVPMAEQRLESLRQGKVTP